VTIWIADYEVQIFSAVPTTPAGRVIRSADEGIRQPAAFARYSVNFVNSV
jgi:hypothetical protein